MKQLNINLKISIPSKSDDFKIVNVLNLNGIDGSLSCYGFDEQGNPIGSLPDQRRKYIIVGGYRSGVSLLANFKTGIETYTSKYVRKDPNNPSDPTMIPQKVLEHKYFEFEAIALMLSRNGAHCDPKFCESEIKRLIKGGIQNIYCTLLSHTFGLDEDYNGFLGGNKWTFGSKITLEDVDFDIANDFLRSIGSNWRILTNKVAKALQLKAFKQLEKNPI